MKIAIRSGIIKALIDDKVFTQEEWENGYTRRHYSSDHERIQFDVEEIPLKVLDKVREIVSEKKNEGDRATLVSLQYWDVLQQDHRSVFVTSLEQVVSAMRNYFSDAPNKWVFSVKSDDQQLLPMFVSNITYFPDEWEIKGRKRSLISEAYVRIQCSYINRRTTLGESFRIFRRDISRKDDGTSVATLLRGCGITKETKAAVAEFMDQVRRYQNITGKTGLQMHAVGYGFHHTSSRTWYNTASSRVPMMRDGRPSKVVIDDIDDEGAVKRSCASDINPSASMDFWNVQQVTANDVRRLEDVDDLYADAAIVTGPTTTVLPTWPYLKVFDLARHIHLEMHVNDLQDYPWDKSAMDKLILPADHKQLISVLVRGAESLMEDIVAGKTGGIIILATGKPGVGKTLTAEVYSEYIEKPVYSVQCSQLGLNVDSIEKNLSAVLERAQRWGALLLMDEADVYIRHRGHDLHHNAIVGVFLRVLEYYRGVLFMTSNRATIIDDAVLSRVTAHIRYGLPNIEERKMLWAVLGAQYGVKLSSADVKKFAETFEVAGRDIKSMLKLATLVDKEHVTLKLMEMLSKFQDTVHTMDGNDETVEGG